LHQSDDPMAYRWHCQHHNIVRLGTLTQVVRDMNPHPPEERLGASQQFASGRERILAARRSTQQAQTLKALMKSLPVLKNLPPPQLASLTEYGSSGSPRANAQHETKPPSAMHLPPDTGSNPKANPSKTTNSSTPTNAPTTSPKPSE